jgi:hypothetical protein
MAYSVWLMAGEESRTLRNERCEVIGHLPFAISLSSWCLPSAIRYRP